jgi:hypothetical protein
MKKRIINSDPAPYPKTNTPEINAVRKFVEILDVDRIKPDVKFLDKIPNTDGTLELVNTSQIPIGKLDVQIKNLNKKNEKKPKYQCEKSFLAFCEQSILPVLLIVVDTKNSIAYWHHIDKTTLKGLAKKLKKDSVNLNFNKDNIIQKDNANYIDKWSEIIEIYQKKLYDYDFLEIQNEKLKSEFSELQKATNISVGKTNPIFREIHLFLDLYNGLLDGDFQTVKNILYPNYWKIGVGILSYQDNSAQFTLYPVSYDLNDVLIKQYNSQDELYLQRVLNYIGFYRENPIKSRPKQYAYELIEGNITEILEKHPLLVKDRFIANEYILAFINKHYLILGLDNSKADYSIAEIEFSLNTFLPLWVQHTHNGTLNKDQKEQIIFPIDYIFFPSFPADIQKASQKVADAIKNGDKPLIEVKIVSTEFNIYILQNLIAFLRSSGVDTIKREYETRHQVNKSSYYIWEAWGEEKTVKNIKVFYNHFIRIYDLLIQIYFPTLKNDLQFYNDFNLLVIVVDFSRVSFNPTPSIEYYYLKSSTSTENKVVIYNSSENEIPVKRGNLRDYFTNGLTIEGNSYRLVSLTSSILDFIYDETPVFTSITKHLKDRMKKYFENKKNSR